MTTNHAIALTSTWSGLQKADAMPTAEAMIDAAERGGHWPTGIHVEGVQTATGINCPEHNAIVGEYREADPRPLGIVGNRYQATTPAQWRELVKAACLAGARPVGVYSLRNGSRVLAVFDVGDDNGIRTQLILADSFDGSMRLTCGISCIRMMCLNQLSAIMSDEGMAKITHTKSLDEKVEALQKGIAFALESGEKIRELVKRAEQTTLPPPAARAAFDALFPEAADDASQRAKTRAENVRHEARLAAQMPINRVGGKGNLATLWNAATYLVDRRGDGTARETRGDSSMVDSMLFGTRAKRVEEIHKLVEIVMADGTVEAMTASEAIDIGADKGQVGAAILASMLDDTN